MAKGNKKKLAKAAAPQTSVAAAPDDQMSLARKIAWWSLLAMIFLVPVAMSNFTWLGAKMPLTYDQFDIFKVFYQRVFGLIALAAWGWDILMRGGKIRRTPVDYLILAFLAWVTISTVLSISPATAFFGKYRRFEGLLSFYNYAVIYFLILQFADRPSRVRTLAQTLFWSGLIVTGYGVLQNIGADPVPWGTLPFEANRAFSTYGNPDLLGGFLMFSLPITLGLVLSEDKLSMRVIYWLGFAVNVWCWIVAFTRGAWIGGFVSIPLVIFIAFRHRAQFFKIDWIPVGAIAALGARIIGVSLRNPNEVMNFAARFKSIFDFESGSGQTRTQIWQAAIAAVQDRPDLRFRPGHLPARVSQVQAGRVRGRSGLQLRRRQRPRLPAAARCGHRHRRRAAVLRNHGVGRDPLSAARVQAFRRSPPHPVRCVLGRVRWLSGAADVRTVGHR